MPLKLEPVSLSLQTPLTCQTWLHHTRDYHLIGIIDFQAPPTYRQGHWDDLEFMRRRVDEFASVGFPEPLAAMVLDLREVPFLVDADAPILPWRLIEEEGPVRILTSRAQRAHYSSVFEPAWLEWDLEICLESLRQILDARLQ